MMHPNKEQEYRMNTQNNAMPGIYVPHFKCRKCKQSRPTPGRVKYAGGGWKCKVCA